MLEDMPLDYRKMLSAASALSVILHGAWRRGCLGTCPSHWAWAASPLSETLRFPFARSQVCVAGARGPDCHSMPPCDVASMSHAAMADARCDCLQCVLVCPSQWRTDSVYSNCALLQAMSTCQRQAFQDHAATS